MVQNYGISASRVHGKELVHEIIEDGYDVVVEIKRCCSSREPRKIPNLAIIILGECEEFQNNMRDWIKTLCIEISFYKFGKSVVSEEVLALIDALNENDAVNGILLDFEGSLKVWNVEELCSRVTPSKDVAGYRPKTPSENSSFDLPASLSICYILWKFKINLSRSKVGIIGDKLDSLKTFHRSLETLMYQQCKEMDEDPFIAKSNIQIFYYREGFCKPTTFTQFCQKQDVLICDFAKAKFITKDMVKRGACIIDIGNVKGETETGESVYFGNTDCEDDSGLRFYPTPGSFALLSEAFLMMGVVGAAENQARDKKIRCRFNEANTTPECFVEFLT